MGTEIVCTEHAPSHFQKFILKKENKLEMRILLIVFRVKGKD